ncbi:MAG TPA: hypothetical protein VJ900_02745 [Patescibacteria group bacterium]|nr:hypothetical protein [Patescibacteria group bacterium]
MEYRLPSFKYYFIGVLTLVIIFVLCWIPSAQINLFLTPEPLIVDFRVNIDTSVGQTFLHLSTIPAQVLPIVKAKANPNFITLNGLTFDNGSKAMIFKKNDLVGLISEKVKNILSQGLTKMEVRQLQSQDWKIGVIEDELMPQRVTLKVTISENTYPIIDENKLARVLVFLKKQNALDKIYQNVSVEKVTIKTHPFFYKRLPIFKSRISFVIKPREL